jgi:P27 family predicted phage terminase small subunit
MKTTDQKNLEGTYRKDRDMEIDDSFPEMQKIQRAPEYFTDNQKKHYKRISALLLECGLIKKIDQIALEQIAIVYDNYEQSTIAINDMGFVNKYDQVSAYYTIQKDSMKMISDFSRRYGMSISDRKKLQMNAASNEGQMDMFEAHRLRKVE